MFLSGVFLKSKCNAISSQRRLHSYLDKPCVIQFGTKSEKKIFFQLFGIIKGHLSKQKLKLNIYIF